MKQSKLRHVGILIKDWERIRPFYEELGFELVYEQEEDWLNAKIMVRKMQNKHGDVLEFISGLWFSHIALTVDESPRKVSFLQHEPQREVSFGKDPEGNWIEFVKEILENEIEVIDEYRVKKVRR